MSKLTIQGIALVLMLLASPLTSAGTSTETTWLSIAGLAVLGIGAAIPPVLRYAGPDDSEDEDEDQDQDENAREEGTR